MEKRTFGILAAIVVTTLLSGISGLILAFAGGVPALVSYMPSIHGATLNIPGNIDVSNLAMLQQGCSCCLCIPIPLVLGFFALRQQAKGNS
jgi:hypothetical protein